MYERAFFHVLRHLYAIHRLDHLVLSGGCASNSVANGKIYQNTPIKSSYIQPAAGDAGGALGAALYSWHVRMGEKRSFRMEHAYWGPDYSDDEIGARIEHRREELTREDCRWGRVEPALLLDRAASAIAEGSVIGWFQGRMEWGSRALGNRSILCDPRRGDMKEILNVKIKHREEFRPFAPAILKERVSDWFEVDDHVPFMMKVLPIRSERRSTIPAVTHVDGTGRLQTVERDQNAMFYGLIEKFADLTGIPMLLNTSFNQNEPIVCSVDEALDCFMRTRMDMLVIGNHIISRRARESGNDRADI
jgi:carbamoyltransferase